ncbi:MAG TPA: tRNA uridine-5-carboxymethylaminomethyl(34) synthesis GTPase MnmE [Gammaproteobacteria bacterium]|nr:tRNA uridine-5-carboxymethylaminomethyl(34) synthesis GTPase MnmE [Gammaproteobacteria bacterium]
MPGDPDTIAAIATPPGAGGVGIVRVSGPAAPRIAQAVLGGLPRPRLAVHRRFLDASGDALDDGVALYFPGPRSYTGEDVLELQGHGGPVVLDALLERCLALGARLARPGEFTQRAFLNGRLDLAQAEAVADLVASGSREAARAALRSLDGALSRRVGALTEALTDLRALVEAAIDFPDEELELLDDDRVAARIGELLERIGELKQQARRGRLVQEGMRVVLAGPPNVGKSSLLNHLAGHDAAIVTAVPGTTRDVLREHIQLDGLPLHLVDTAGLRQSPDAVEAEGVRRARREIETADRVLLMVEDHTAAAVLEGLLRALPEHARVTVLRNKVDLGGGAAGPVSGSDPPALRLSVLTGAGLTELREHLKQCAGYQGPARSGFSARRRHLEALERACAALGASARSPAGREPELLAEDLRQAQLALGEITGAVTTEDLLGRIFSSFCIGK